MGRSGNVERLFAVVRLASLLIAAVAVFMLLRVPQPSPEEAVRQTFAAYKRAIVADDGPAAAALLSTGTVEWYGKVLDLTLHGSSEEIEQLGTLEKLQVLGFRQRVPVDELRAMSPRELFAYAVRRGWVGKPNVGSTEIGAITVTDDTAVARALFAGKDSGQQYRFVREGDRWLFDQLPTLQAGGDLLTAAARDHGVPVDEFVQHLVESASGKKVTPDLWQPPFPRATAAAP
jgi:hypothetical protein